MSSPARVHHINCGTMSPPLLGAAMVCHVLLVETAAGLVLVDTGLGTGDLADRGRRLPGLFRAAIRPALEPAETAVAQVRALGLDPREVRHIVVTHLDLDHAGGIGDFPWATVHLHRREREAARARATRLERRRYLPAQLDGHERWIEYDDREGDEWMGLRAARPLSGLGDELALVPLHGHTRGHSAVAVRAAGGWLLHAGDAYFHREELARAGGGPLALRGFQRAVEVNRRERLDSQERLRALARDRSGEVRVFCSHDPSELAELAGLAPAGDVG